MPRVKGQKKLTVAVTESPVSVSDSERSSQLEQSSITEPSNCESETDQDESFALTRLRKRAANLNEILSKKKFPKRGMAKLGSPSGNNETVYCVCRKPYNDRFMIECDECHEWYHGDCIGISLRQGKQMEKRNKEYVCDACRAKHSNLTQESDSGEEDESISLAAIRQQVVNKQPVAVEISEKSLQFEDNDNLNRKMSPEPDVNQNDEHSDILSRLQREVAEIKDLETLKKTLFSTDTSMMADDRMADDAFDLPAVIDEIKPEIVDTVPVGKRDIKEENLADRTAPALADKNKAPTKIAKQPSSAVGANANSSSVQSAPQSKRMKESSGSSLDPNRCFVGDCENRPMIGSIYCSPGCLRNHCQQSIELLRLAQACLQKNNNPGGSEAQPTELRLSVIDAKSGRLINDHKLVNEKTIEKFISRHPTFRIVTPQATPSMLLQQQPSASTSVATSTTSHANAINAFRLTVRTELRDALKMRVEGVDDAMFSTSEISRTALRTEEAMFKLLGGAQADKYKQRFRSLVLNIKDSKNKGLFRRILLGNFSAEEIATMPAERLASDELVQWREQQRKKSLEMLIADGQHASSAAANSSGNSISKQSSGSLIPGMQSPPPVASPPSLTHADLASMETFTIDTTKHHREHLFDVNCRICTGKSGISTSSHIRQHATNPHPVKTSYADVTYASNPVASGGSVSMTATRSVSSSTGSALISTSIVTTVSSSSAAKPSTPSRPQLPSSRDDPSRSQDQAPANSPPRPQLEVEWFGRLKLDALAPDTPIHGRLISVTQNAHLEKFPETLEVVGKLATPAVWDYLDKIRKAANKEILAILLEPTKVTDSNANYRTALASLKERSRYAVARTAQPQVPGGYKDIYLTYTNTEWLRRLTAYGMRFTEQLPLESKLACIFVRYTGPVTSTPSQQTTVPQAVSVIPLSADNTSSKSAADATPPPDSGLQEHSVDHSVEEEEVYDPSNFSIPERQLRSTANAKSESQKTVDSSVTVEHPPLVPVELPYVPLAKPLQQSPSVPEERSKMKPVAPAVLSTPEEVSSVSELIRRILGSTVTGSNSSVATPPSASAASPDVEKIETVNKDKAETIAEDGNAGKVNDVILPVFPSSSSPMPHSFPPPPPGFFPPFPPPPMPMLPPPGNVYLPAIPPGPLSTMSSQMAMPIPPPPFPLALPFHPTPPLNLQSVNRPESEMFEIPPFSTEMKAISESEQLIWRYLDQLLDETMSLAMRTNLLQELALLLQNPENEDIVKHSPELTERFQKAVAIVNAVVEKNRPPAFEIHTESQQVNNGNIPSFEEASRVRRKSSQPLLPTPDTAPLYQRHPISNLQQDSAAKPQLFTAQSNSATFENMPMNNQESELRNPYATSFSLFHQRYDSSLQSGCDRSYRTPPPLLLSNISMPPHSEWKQLLRAYRERLKGAGGPSSTQMSTASESSRFARGSRSQMSADSSSGQLEFNEQRYGKNREKRFNRMDEDESKGRRVHRRYGSGDSFEKRGRDSPRDELESRSGRHRQHGLEPLTRKNEDFLEGSSKTRNGNSKDYSQSDADAIVEPSNRTALEQFVSAARKRASAGDEGAALSDRVSPAPRQPETQNSNGKRSRWEGANDYGPVAPVTLAKGNHTAAEDQHCLPALFSNTGYSTGNHSFGNNRNTYPDPGFATSGQPLPSSSGMRSARPQFRAEYNSNDSKQGSSSFPNVRDGTANNDGVPPARMQFHQIRQPGPNNDLGSTFPPFMGGPVQPMTRTINNSARGRGGPQSLGRGNGDWPSRGYQPRKRGGYPMRGGTSAGGNFGGQDSRPSDAGSYAPRFSSRY